MSCQWIPGCPTPAVTRVRYHEAETGDLLASVDACEPHATEATFGPLSQYLPDRVTTCRSCGAPIRWQKTASGKNMPVDETGEPHWATCPQADQWRR